jgi:hypothetical protein
VERVPGPRQEARGDLDVGVSGQVTRRSSRGEDPTKALSAGANDQLQVGSANVRIEPIAEHQAGQGQRPGGADAMREVLQLSNEV